MFDKPGLVLKINKAIICLITGMLFFLDDGIGQNKKTSFAIGIDMGGSGGWWVYHKGSLDPSNYNDQGIDKIQFSGFINYGVSFTNKVNAFKLTGVIQQVLLFEDKMRTNLDSRLLNSRYPVSTGSVKFWMYSLETEYDWIKNKYYILSPKVGFGIFSINTLHPEKDNFGKKYFWKIGINNQVCFNNYDLLFECNWVSRTILPKTEKFEGENHKIYSVGVQAGIRFWLF